ncbi:MAG TPA: hypothetical protein PK543_00075 [Candidatus Saccharibacteria bacterium]|nr:hypothetical protein [Candidatus Saccharibacteria bacterium]
MTKTARKRRKAEAIKKKAVKKQLKLMGSDRGRDRRQVFKLSAITGIPAIDGGE